MNALEDFSNAGPAGPMLPAFGPVVRYGPVFPSFDPVQPPQPQPQSNCRSAAEMQQVAGDFSAADDWFTLGRTLRRKGVRLKMRKDGLWIYDAASHAALAACKDLGIGPDELELRFGPSKPPRPAAQCG